MAILEHELRSAVGAGVTGLQRHLFTREEYRAMDFGDRRVELIEGEIIDLAPIGHPHAAINDPLAILLRAAWQ